MIDIRVLLVEYSLGNHEGLKEGFTKSLRSVGYSPIIEIAISIDNALDKIKTEDIDLLITDLTFNVSFSVGLDFIKKAKHTKPDICIVACSSGAPSIDQIRANQPSFDVFVPKRVVHSAHGTELEELGQDIKNNLGKLSGLTIQFGTGSISDLRVSGLPITLHELRSLIGQVLADLEQVSTPFKPSVATLTSIAGGYSGSLVLLLELSSTPNEIAYVKTVLKISEYEWASDEASNFNKYVKWLLPFNKRVELVGVGRTKHFGAVAYTFVFGDETSIGNLTDLIELNDTTAVESYIDIIFDDELVHFYNATRIESSQRAGEHYRERYFPDDKIDLSDRIMKEVVLRNFGGEQKANDYLVHGELYPDPMKYIFSGLDKTFHLSVIHGDFNSNNIMCADKSRVAYIDFQDTGPGHVLQDVMALECSFRLNWKGNEPLEKQATIELLEMELGLYNSPSTFSNPDDYTKICSYLRNVAKLRFSALEDWEYPYSAMALSLKLLRLPDLSETQKCRLVACALVSAGKYSEIVS